MTFGDLLLTVFEIFLFVVWIWILFTIITDLFRNHEMSGWLKGVWIVLLIFIPYLVALIYLIVYGSDMRERSLRAQAEAKHEADAYIRAAAHSSPADELHKLHELVEKGALTEAEYDRAKQKLLAG
ncbi:MAG: SHOCT domain-containing protein [Actinobacteria bacterium]|nr:SHOCT domain-containing protein [Actinomycetota bacterium]MBS1883846.1 SHOCT domain-containing protein [Actinomycetota bacterium]